METQIYNQEGKKTGKIQLPDAIFGARWNADLLHQVVVGFLANKRTPIAHTKDRSEVRGGGHKPWRQKGTGRARHGSSRSPLWRGGGITFGPRNDKDYSKKINKKMKIKALYIALSQKVRDGEVLFVDTLSFVDPKTAKGKTILTALSGVKGFETLVSKKSNSALIAQSDKDIAVEKSFNNMSNIEVGEVRNLNAYDILSHKYIIITEPEKAVLFFGSKGGSALGIKKEVVDDSDVSQGIMSTDQAKIASADVTQETSDSKTSTKKAPAKKAVKKVVKK